MAAGDVEVNLNTPNGRKCFLYDGADDYTDVAHHKAFLGANYKDGFTVSAWCLVRGAGESDTGRIMDLSTDTTAGDGFWFIVTTVGRFQLRINGGTGVVSGNNAYTEGTWVHCLWTITSAGLCSCYINGVANGTPNSTEATSTITSTRAIRIGNRAEATDRAYDGAIAGAKMWNRVLTSAEITKVAADEPVEDGLLFDVPLADSAVDVSQYAHTVTNSGAQITALESNVAAAIKADRTTANDHYMLAKLNGKILSCIVEEA